MSHTELLLTPSVFVGVPMSANGWSAHSLPIMNECCVIKINNVKGKVNLALSWHFPA
jgi:hypothetical protein